jgi:trehalose 6-phosphate phosphatase
MPKCWTEARAELACRLTNPARLLVACDYDGTLAPIAPTPSEASLSARAERVLRKVASLPGVCLAIVSGRALDDLAARIQIPNVLLVGNHGFETRGLGLDGEVTVTAAQREELAAFMVEVRQQLGKVPGILIEDKRLTASVHYRNASPAHFSHIVETMNRLVTARPGLDLHHGKMVWEVKPQVSCHKGTALRNILEHLGQPDSTAVFLGDDTTDEFAFESLPNAVTINIGSSRATKAGWRAEDPDDAVRFLVWLVALRRGRESLTVP